MMALPAVRTYASASGVVTPWTGFGSVEVAFDRYGSASAQVTLPRLVGGSPNPLLSAGSLFPQGEGVLLEIDARALGTTAAGSTVRVPDVWLGRITDPEVGDSASPEVTISANGPHADLGEYTVPAAAVPPSGPAGVVAADFIRGYPVDLGIDVGTVHEGTPVPAVQTGGTVAGMLDALADTSASDYTLVALPGMARWRMDWTDSLSPLDYTGTAGGPAVTLIDDGGIRQNARIEVAYGFTRSRKALVEAAGAWNRGGPMAVRATATGTVLGRRGALSALVSTAAVRRFEDDAADGYRPDLTTLPAIEAQVVADLRRRMRPALAFQAEVLDLALWRYMRPLALVLVRMPDEVTRLYRYATAQIRTVTFSVTAPYGCQISGELWSVDGG